MCDLKRALDASVCERQGLVLLATYNWLGALRIGNAIRDRKNSIFALVDSVVPASMRLADDK